MHSGRIGLDLDFIRVQCGVDADSMRVRCEINAKSIRDAGQCRDNESMQGQWGVGQPGETSFFLHPGERLEKGIQDVDVLAEDEALLLQALETYICCLIVV